MSVLLTALSRNDIAQYVDSLFQVYIILIIARIVLSWVITFRGSLPYNPVMRGVSAFLEQTVDPYLRIFRRFLPSIGGSRMALDLSPIVGIFVLFLIQAFVVGLINE